MTQSLHALMSAFAYRACGGSYVNLERRNRSSIWKAWSLVVELRVVAAQSPGCPNAVPHTTPAPSVNMTKAAKNRQYTPAASHQLDLAQRMV